jgi:stage II sporulation protein AA (anti-sigma F factor antagonist)
VSFDDFKIKIIEDIAIVTVDLLVATQRDAKPLWDELDNKSILEWDKVIIDLSLSTFIDSTFVGMIVKIFKTLSGNNGQLKLVFPEKNARIYLHTTGIIKVVDCFNTLNEAVNSFNSKMPTRKISFDEEILNY